VAGREADKAPALLASLLTTRQLFKKEINSSRKKK